MAPIAEYTLHRLDSNSKHKEFNLAALTELAALAVHEHNTSPRKYAPARGLLVRPGQLPAGVETLAGLPVRGEAYIVSGHMGVY